MRAYCVGLPVVITVHDDGRISYEVDTSEAGAAIWDDESADDEVTDEERQADQRAIEADHDEHRGVTVDRTP